MGSVAAESSRRAALEILQSKLEGRTRQVLKEYDVLREADPTDVAIAASQEPVNSRRNRYFNVIPYDFDRVILQGSGHDYINASFLQSAAGEQPAWSYIATQGPLENTAADFWRMVWEQNSGVIIMLTRNVEAGVLKCSEYFPATVGASQTYGDFTVQLEAARRLDEDITMNSLRLAPRAGGPSRPICHYHYHAWPDHGIPRSTRPLRRLAHLLEDTKAATDGPPVVHCSAGIGRTGTFCTVDIVLRRLRALASDEGKAEAAQAVAIPQIVGRLRQQRVGMVQTHEQYLFCNLAILEELQDS